MTAEIARSRPAGTAQGMVTARRDFRVCEARRLTGRTRNPAASGEDTTQPGLIAA
ncbi:hypothetical protein [Maritimibacter sp. 55A14]|uniref:hypothetical protein n=1 Tax=Maritimibacter sp. 55A14 TaxID=2174844 RepID=UPI001304E390|nr:hypothetical protein [Maritimibacter sp. 55A14]